LDIAPVGAQNNMLQKLTLLLTLSFAAQAAERHYIYAASPGVRNYVEYGGIGIVVFDADHGYKFVKRFPTWDVPAGQKPENVKGIAASAKTGIVYVTTLNHMSAFDIVSGKRLWDKTYEGGCDRMAISPDGKTLYVPSLEGPFWNVVNGATGDVITKVEPKSGSHNTIWAPDGSRVYMAGLKSPLLNIADPTNNTIVKTVGPFSNVIRPFTVNGSNTLCFVNLNDLLGFEVGDIRTGKKLYRVEITGEKTPVKRHGCPSHGIAMNPEETELWVADGPHNKIYIFDATVMPPKQMTSVAVKDLPGWITFSIDGKTVISSSGEVFDARTKKLITNLKDEHGQDFQSEKLLEIDLDGNKVVRAGNQFGVGMKMGK
jgi:DNA-binding beta-propeller fold protein YncE